MLYSVCSLKKLRIYYYNIFKLTFQYNSASQVIILLEDTIQQSSKLAMWQEETKMEIHSLPCKKQLLEIHIFLFSNQNGDTQFSLQNPAVGDTQFSII